MSDKQDSLFVPYTESKSQAERIAYVKANPDKYKPYAQYLSLIHISEPTRPY